MTDQARPIEIVVCVRPPTDDGERPSWRSLAELDLRAVELARLLAEPIRAQTTAVSIGPPEPASQVLTECLARGIDRALRVGDERLEDGLSVAAGLAEALRPVGPDLILCGQRSGAGAHGVVGAALADRLGLPLVSNVVGLDVDWSRREARCTQMLERGARWCWSAALPMVCAVERDVAAPRYLATRRLARARAAGGVGAVGASVADAAGEIVQEFGVHAVESRGLARIRPKKTKAPPKKMSAADRMKFLRGGGATGPAAGDDQPRKISGSPEDAAREILALLEKEELL